MALRTATVQAYCSCISQRALSALARHGFAIQHLSLEGCVRVNPQHIKDILGVQPGDNIFQCNLQRAFKEIKQLPWVDAVLIERRLPNALSVKVVEKQPLAFWQNDRRFYLIDRRGQVILPVKTTQGYPDFIVATGVKAPEEVPKLLENIKAYPHIRRQVVGAALVSERRWDLFLRSGIRVKLPEVMQEERLRLLETLLQQGRLSHKQVVGIDLRGGDRILLQMRDSSSKKEKKVDKKA